MEWDRVYRQSVFSVGYRHLMMWAARQSELPLNCTRTQAMGPVSSLVGLVSLEASLLDRGAHSNSRKEL